MTINSGINLKQDFNLDKEESDFDNIIDSDEDIKDENLQLVS